jgi:hypothetical protein
MGREDVVRKDLREIGVSWKDVKRVSLNRLEWRKSVCCLGGLRRLGAAVSCLL